jgi:hypothetical protein
MKPQDRNYQAATQVKVLSPVISHVREAESFHLLKGNKMNFVMVKNLSLSRGLSPQRGSECNSQKLGRSKQFSRVRIFANNPKRREGKNDCLEVGLFRSKGVAGVMSCESKTHLKGTAVVCRGKGRHSPHKELE